MALSNKQLAFVNEYLRCWNATEAARLAGYKGNDKSLATIGWENLRKLEIADAIKQRVDAMTMSANEALLNLTEIARGTMSDFVDLSGNLDLTSERPGEPGRVGNRAVDEADEVYWRSHDRFKLVKKIKQKTVVRAEETEYTKEIELYSRLEALELLGRHHSLFNDKVTINFNPEDLTDEQLSRIAAGEDPAKVLRSGKPTQ